MAEENLWMKEDSEGVTVGLTAVAQDDLGNISFAMLPKVGSEITLGEGVVELEAEKAVVEYESPVSGTVISVNEAALKDTSLLDQPDAWLYKVKK
ncbi:glycine cleavage system protein H [Vagococcus carniphilus]|uniref:glycine cleavage system protein H n=1 Tax=Vagococcus carniphilus TaxID=218144 RepID=UPI002890D27A|nr:glycine cleavage system protein H [Vagococcus carniphilus]MDT2831688.1 glycine cleavage system protein H [Vagococcus carniphilus]MDT2840404.1 glycine cleavage system protein H [Vagococcus carniphilus]MDT2855062.1 glycine cleavage system protein H [Vagococcus carniphilus]